MIEVDTIKDQTDENLLKLWSVIMKTLRERKTLRSSNNPVSDYAEKLVAQS